MNSLLSTLSERAPQAHSKMKVPEAYTVTRAPHSPMEKPSERT